MAYKRLYSAGTEAPAPVTPTKTTTKSQGGYQRLFSGTAATVKKEEKKPDLKPNLDFSLNLQPETGVKSTPAVLDAPKNTVKEKTVDLAKAGLDAWNTYQQWGKAQETEMYNRTSGKPPVTTEEREANAPLIKALNTPTGKKIITGIVDKTSNLGIKSEALKLAMIGDATYQQAYDYYLMDRENPNNGALKKFLYDLQDSGPQSLVGMLMAAATTYATKSLAAGVAVSAPYYSALSAGEQIKERGEVKSLGNIAIDTIGDEVINTMIGGLFKAPAKTFMQVVKQAFVTEAGTEPTQTLLKYFNDYGNARTEEQKALVIKEAVNYVKSGGILEEALIGGITGAIGGGAASIASKTFTENITTSLQPPVKQTGAVSEKEEKTPGEAPGGYKRLYSKGTEETANEEIFGQAPAQTENTIRLYGAYTPTDTPDTLNYFDSDINQAIRRSGSNTAKVVIDIPADKIGEVVKPAAGERFELNREYTKIEGQDLTPYIVHQYNPPAVGTRPEPELNAPDIASRKNIDEFTFEEAQNLQKKLQDIFVEKTTKAKAQERGAGEVKDFIAEMAKERSQIKQFAHEVLYEQSEYYRELSDRVENLGAKTVPNLDNLSDKQMDIVEKDLKEEIHNIDEAINKIEDYERTKNEEGSSNQEAQRAGEKAQPSEGLTGKKKGQVDPSQKMPTKVVDTSDPVGESDIPSRRTWGKQMEKFLIDLNTHLGWYLDHNQKGKAVKPKLNHDYISTVFWKPGSKYGIYISVNSNTSYEADTTETGTVLLRYTTEEIKWTGGPNQFVSAGLDISTYAAMIKNIVKDKENQDVFREGVEELVAEKKAKPAIIPEDEVKRRGLPTETPGGIPISYREKPAGLVTEKKQAKKKKQYPTIYASTDGETEIKMVDGESVDIIDGVETFVHKGDGGWVVSEASTGRHIGSGTTKDRAVADAKSNIARNGKERFLELIEKNKLPEEGAEPEGLTKQEKSATNKLKQYGQAGPGIIRGKTDEKGVSGASEVGAPGQAGIESASEVDRRPAPRRGYYFGNDKLRKRFANVVELNNAAIELLRERQSADPKDYTADELALLSLYSGAGGLERQGETGRGLLDEYYTPYKVASFIWEKLAKLTDLTKPNIKVLEPSIGTGVFAFTAPKNIKNIVGYEISPTSAKIAQLLNPRALVYALPFESNFVDQAGKKLDFKKDFDIVVGNPPYGAHRGEYKGLGEESKIGRYEEYFIKRALDMTKNDGLVALVVPSGFLRSSENYAKQQIANMAQLVDAYRLPNGAFSTTEIGTDIVIFKKNVDIPKYADLAMVNLFRLSDDQFFQDVPENIIGQEVEKKGRFGMEKYVKGSLEDLPLETEMIEEQAATEAEDVAPDTFKKIEKETDAENKEVVQTETQKQAAEDKAIDDSLPKPTSDFTVYINNRDKDLKKHSDINVTESQKQGWINTRADGSINDELAGKLTEAEKLSDYSFADKKWYLDFNYASGNIYEALERLERDKAEISQAQYKKQKALLESVLPKPTPLNEINVDARAPFIRNFKMGDKDTLLNQFRDFLMEKMPRDAFGDLTRSDVIGYLDGEAVRGNDKIRNQYVRDNRGRVANEMFSGYLKNVLEPEAQQRFTEEFNRLYNGFYYPDYTSVPLLTHTLRKINGNEFNLNPAQRRAIGFLLSRGVGTAALDVGVGKTYASLIALQEAMARGWTKKPLIVVEKNTYRQWKLAMSEIMPEVRINDWYNLGSRYDKAIIDGTLRPDENTITLMSYNGFTRLRFKDETYAEFTNQMADDVEIPGKKTKRQGETELAKVEEARGKVKKGTKDVYFEDAGFDHITLDEAQNFNHIIASSRKVDRSSDSKEADEFTLRINPSQRGLLAWYAAQYIQKKNNGRNVTLLTATPFTNNPLEYYSILSLTSYKSLKARGLENINEFLTTFMELEDAPQFTMDGQFRITKQIKSFKNARELKALLNESMIFIDGDEAGVIRPKKAVKQHVLKRSPLQVDLINDISEEIKKLGNSKENAGKKLALFGQIISTTLTPYATARYQQYEPGKVGYKQFVEGSPKIKAAMEVIRQNKQDKAGNQIIYCPLVNGADGLNIFGLMKDYLVKELGYKEGQVGIINGATKDDQRELIQNGFNEGRVKVIIGSGAIMRGVNLQKQTTDIHALILPWNYEDFRQLSGRAWRQGNRYSNVRVRQYLMEDSGDIFVSQKLAVKEARSQSLASLKGEVKNNVLDAGLITFEEALNGLVTDPVVRVQMEEEMTKRDIERKLTMATSNLVFLNKKLGLEKLEELDAQERKDKMNLDTEKLSLNNQLNWAKEDPYWADRAKEQAEEVKKYEKLLAATIAKKKKIIQEREELGVDMSQIKQAQENIVALTEKKAGLEAEFKTKKAEAEALRAADTKRGEESDYNEIRNKVFAENAQELDFADWFKKAKKVKTSATGMLSGGGQELGKFENRTLDNPADAQKLFDFTIALVNKYAKKIGQGYVPKGAGGVYYPDSKNIRVTGYNALSYVAHELAHFIDFSFNISRKIMGIKGYAKNGNPVYDADTRQYRKEMTLLYEQYYEGGKRDHPLKQRAQEGLATLIQKYIEMPGTVAAQYPNLVNDFLKPGGKFYIDTVGEMIAEVNQYVAKYQGMNNLDKVGARVVSDKVNVDKAQFFSIYDKIKFQTSDMVYPTEKLERKAGRAFTEDDSSLYVRLYNNINSIIFNNFKKKGRGYFQMDPDTGNLKKTLPFNWRDLHSRLSKGKTFDDFAFYLVARNEYYTFEELKDKANEAEQMKEEIASVGGLAEAAKMVGEDGKSLLQNFKELLREVERLNMILKNDGFTYEEVKGAYFENQERFVEEERMFDALVRQDLNNLRKNRLLTQKEYDRYTSRKGYASMKRDFTDQLLGDEYIKKGAISMGGTKVSAMIPRKGSARPIINPLYSALASHSEATKKAMKQTVFNKMTELAPYFPDLFQRLELIRAKDGLGRIIYPQEKDQKIIMARDKNGKRVPYLVQDDYVLKALHEVLSGHNVEVFESLVLGAARAFTKGTTGLFPGFTFTNFSIDQITAGINTRNGYTPLLSPLKQLVQAVSYGKGIEYEYFTEYMVMGGDRQTIVGWQDMSPRELSMAIQNERAGVLKLVDMVNRGVDIFALPAKYSEIMTRATEYVKARKAGKPSIVALEEAGRVSAPFHHLGFLGGRPGQMWVRSLPFFNPSIQVLAQTISTLHTNEGKKRFAFILLAVTASLIASMRYLLDKGTDEQKELYRDIEPEQLAQYIFLPSQDGKSLVQVRIPDQIGFLGGVINMVLMNRRYEDDYKMGDFIAIGSQWLPRQLNITKPYEAALAWIPQIIKPAVLTAANIKDFPSIRPLESQTQLRKLPELRVNEGTTKLARLLGPKLKMSPLKIDYLIQGYFGRATGFITGKPGLYNPFSSLTRNYYFSYGRRVSNYYDLKEKNDQEWTALSKEQKQFSPDEAVKITTTRERLKEVDKLLDDYRDIDLTANGEQAAVLRWQILELLKGL